MAASEGVAIPPATNNTTRLDAILGDLLDQPGWGLQLLGGDAPTSSFNIEDNRRISAPIVRMFMVALETSPVPASPFERIIAAPSLMRRSASPRFVAPQTNGTVNFHLSMWLSVVRRGQHLGLVDVVHAQALGGPGASTK